MPIHIFPDTTLRVPTELNLVSASGTGLTVDVGHGKIAAVSYSGADVSTNLQDVADITDPSAWTDLIDLSGSKMLVIVDQIVASGLILTITIDENEDAGEDIRAQILVDSVVVADITVTRDAGGSVTNSVCGSVDRGYCVFECRDSFKIRACCEGDNFGDAGTVFYMGEVFYQKLR